LLIASVFEIAIDAGRPILASDILENEPVFQRMRRTDESRFRLGQNLRGIIGRNVFVQIVVHHANRRGAATGETFHKLDTEIAVGANRHRMVHPIGIVIPDDSGNRAKIFHRAITAGHRATQCPANANVRFPGLLLPEHWIESDELENIDRRQTELGCNPIHSFIVDEFEMFLPQMQQRHRCASRSIVGIPRDRLVHFLFQLGGNMRTRRDHRKARLLGQRTVLGLHFVVFENDRDRVFSLLVDVDRFFHHDEIFIVD
jgi:hypothetical protein